MREWMTLLESETATKPQFFMHVTALKNVASILKTGLVPNGGHFGNYDNVRWESLEGVYASRDTDQLLGYISAHNLADFAVVVVQIDPQDHLPDEDMIDNNLRVIFDSACKDFGVDPEADDMTPDFDEPFWTRVYTRFAETLGAPVEDEAFIKEMIADWFTLEYEDSGDILMVWGENKDKLVRTYPHMHHVITKNQFSVRVPDTVGFEGRTKIVAVVESRRGKVKLAFNQIPPEEVADVKNLLRGLADYPQSPEEMKKRLIELAVAAHPERSRTEIEMRVAHMSPHELGDMLRAYENR